LRRSVQFRDLEDREGKIRRLVDAKSSGPTKRFCACCNTAVTISAPAECVDRSDADGMRELDERALAELKAARIVQPYEKDFFTEGWHPIPVLAGTARFQEVWNEDVAFVLDLSEQKRAEAEIKALKEQDPPIPKFMLFLIHQGHGSERRGVGPPFQPHPPPKPLVSMYRSMRACLVGGHTARDCYRPKAARRGLPPSDVHDGRRPPFGYRQ
jgi:hypothetical protein